MSNEFVVGILTTIFIAGFSGFYLILRSEVRRIEEKIDSGFKNSDLKINNLDSKINTLESKMYSGFRELEQRMNAGFRESDQKMNNGFRESEQKMNAGFNDLKKDLKIHEAMHHGVKE